MGKRMLVTSTDLMMIQFLVPHIQNLAEHGFEMEIACSNVGGRLEEIRAKLKGYVKAIHVVRLVRSPASLINLKGCQDMKKIVDKGHYDIIWTNEPVMGVVTRLAARKARKKGTKVLYMVHGFHFYKGAPKLNWMIYYPIERYMSRLADVIVTINKEDYARAKGFHSKKVEYIHGIGVDTDRLKERSAQGNIREELGFSKDDFIVVSVGELNKNKNHKTIIQAVSLLKDDHIKYVICGKGILQKQLEETAEKHGISGQVFFLGYRKDVVDICSQSDVFAFPSYREGLGLAPLEAMYVGLPIVASDIRGVKDYVINGKTGFLCQPGDSKAFAQAILKLKNDKELRQVIGQNNYGAVVPYCLENVKEEVTKLFCQEEPRRKDEDKV